MLQFLIPFLCVNGVSYHVELAIQDVQEAERQIEVGNYADALRILDGGSYGDGDLGRRVEDMRAVIAMRTHKKNEITAWVLPHFRDRMKHNKGEVRYQAWLAEAQLRYGSQTVALALIKELERKDLMPDAFAYLTLAKLNIGAQRESALAACRTREKKDESTKSICKI